MKKVIKIAIFLIIGLILLGKAVAFYEENENFKSLILALDLGTVPAWITAVIASIALIISKNSFKLSNKANKLNIRKLALDIHKDSISISPHLKVYIDNRSTEIGNPVANRHHNQTLRYCGVHEFNSYWKSVKGFRLCQVESRYIEVKFTLKLTVGETPIILNDIQSKYIELIKLLKDGEDENLLQYGSITLETGKYSLYCKLTQRGESWARHASYLYDRRTLNYFSSDYFGFDTFRRITDDVIDYSLINRIVIDYSSLYNKNIRSYWHIVATGSALKINKDKNSYIFSINNDFERSIVLSPETNIKSIERDIIDAINNNSEKI